MTEAQRAALEALIGRALTEQELAAIEPYISDPDNRNDVAIAAVLSQGRTKIVPHLMTDRGVIGALGTIDGEAFIVALESVVATDLPEEHPLKPHQAGIKRMLAWLERDPGLDIGSPRTQALLAMMGQGGALDEDLALTVARLAERPDPLSVSAVSDALNTTIDHEASEAATYARKAALWGAPLGRSLTDDEMAQVRAKVAAGMRLAEAVAAVVAAAGGA